MSVKSEKSSSASGVNQSFVLTRESLARLKLKAVRRGIWFSGLKHEERRLLDLTVRVVQRIHSFLLAKLISKIVEKLVVSMQSSVLRLMKTEGYDLAVKLARIAQNWGNSSAKSWNRNRGFIQYLTVTQLLS